MSPRVLGRAVLAAAAALLILAPAARAARSVVVAFVPPPAHGALLDRLGADHNVAALGLLNPTVGDYNQEQALLDLTQSNRLVATNYKPSSPPVLAVAPSGRVSGWAAALARARRASSEIEPGLLAQLIPGGAAYAGPGAGLDALLAADRSGRIAGFSIGGGVVRRVESLVRRYQFVAADLAGIASLDELLSRRAPDELVFAVERPPPTAPGARRAPLLLAIGATGLPGGPGELATRTTRRHGLVTALDLAPTVLDWLALRTPSQVKGLPLTVAGSRDPARLRKLAARLPLINGRRFVTIEAFLLAWLVAILFAGTLADRAGLRAALRLGGLAALWTPTTVLIAAALRPGRAAEVAIIVGADFLFAALSDRLAPWPRGPALPAAAMVIVNTVDLARGSPLIATSLLGPSPIFGTRFYGVGNEMEAALPIVLFAGLAAALPQRAANRRDALLFAAAGLAFTAIAAWGRLGADVGALFTIGGGTAAAAVLLAPGGVSQRNVALAIAVPIVGLGVLALLDLATGAGSHYTRTVLHASSAGDVLDTGRHKLNEAWHVLRHGLMPLEAAICLLGGAYVIRHRSRALAPVAGAPIWLATLGGGFIGSILGSLTNDSGPQLLVIGSFGLACLIAYIRGDPRLAPS